MALTITGVPDARWYLGPSLQSKLLQLQPASADYVTGGYVITAEQCEFGNGHIYGAQIMSQVYGTTNIFPMFCLPSGSYAAGAPQPSTTQINLALYESGGTTPSGTITIPIGTNVGTTSPVYAGNVANTFTTTGAATSITNATFTGSAGAAGFLSELAAATDVSAYTFWAIFWGY